MPEVLTIASVAEVIQKVLTAAALAPEGSVPRGSLKLYGTVGDENLRRLLAANDGVLKIEIREVPSEFVERAKELSEVVNGQRSSRPEETPDLNSTYYHPEGRI